MKVLEIIDGYSFGGIAKLMYDLSNNINDIDMDFLSSINIYDKWNNLNADRRTLYGKFIYNHRLKKYLKNNKYDIVHINTSAFFFSFQVVLICKICKIKRIVVHSHNTPKINLIKRVLIKLLNPLYMRLTDVHLSCSNDASKSLYCSDKDVIILKNGIEINKFKFNSKIRNKIRKELNIENKIVYGHVGRFEKQKNHNFLIDLFYELQKDNDSVLLLVGSGSLEDEIKTKVKELKIEDKVLFLGFREDINNILNVMDIFIFPSLYEGLGISLIEAQTSGLPTIVSNNVPEEAHISNRFIKLSSFNVNDWVNTIKSIKISKRDNAYKDTLKAGYDIKKSAEILNSIYKDLIDGDIYE